MRRNLPLALAILTTALVSLAPPARADEATNNLLKPLREKHKLPGIVGAILQGDKLVAVGAVGVRKVGSPEPITINDKVHIGSCTKAMTATRIAMLVEEKKLTWQTTIADVFPELNKTIHQDYRGVTLAQLLTHRAGLPADVDWWDLGTDKPTTEQRRTLLSRVLKDPPEQKPGTKFSYSNVGYCVAAAIAEKITRTSWEELLRRGLFQPLGMNSAGYGPPGGKNKVDQPWGHLLKDGRLQALQEDNAPVLGPAGTVHCSIADWAKFAALHLQGGQGKARLLKPATFTMLHTPPQDGEYAFGWLVAERPWAGGMALTHGGSNTMWYAIVWIAPKRGFAMLAAVNQGGDSAHEACDEAISLLIERAYKDFSKKEGR